MSKYRSTPKLTAAQVKKIRKRSERGEKGSALAKEFGVSPAAVSMIIRGVTWSDIQGPLKDLPPRTSAPPTEETTERWRPVPGYEGLYSVSDCGNVRIEVTRRNIRTGTHLRQTPDPDGYLIVTLTDTRTPRNCRVSLVVLAAFVGPRPPGQETNHKDGNRQNNRLENLEYITKPQNVKHSIEVLGSTRQGAKNPAAKLTEQRVLELRERAAAGDNYRVLGEAFGVSSVMVGKIARGESWSHIGGPLITGRPRGRPPKGSK